MTPTLPLIPLIFINIIIISLLPNEILPLLLPSHFLTVIIFLPEFPISRSSPRSPGHSQNG